MTNIITKTCSNCQQEKNISEFSWANKKENRRHYYCKKCYCNKMREYNANNADRIKAQRRERYSPEKNRRGTLSKYGITLEQFNDMYKLQKGRCAICGNKFVSKFHTHLDHCHETGTVRGILCNHCNLALGHFKDDTTLLQKAIAYLKGDR